MPAPAGTVHARTLTKPSRAGAVVSRPELVELGAATCVVGVWLGHGLRKKQSVEYQSGFVVV